MTERQETTLFRKKAMERISSPEERRRLNGEAADDMPGQAVHS